MAVITNVLVAFVPAAVMYYVLKQRIDEVKEFSFSTRKRMDDNLDYIFEELNDIRMLRKPDVRQTLELQTQTLSTSAPAVMVSAPKPRAKRAKKAK